MAEYDELRNGIVDLENLIKINKTLTEKLEKKTEELSFALIKLTIKQQSIPIKNILNIPNSNIQKDKN